MKKGWSFLIYFYMLQSGNLLIAQTMFQKTFGGTLNDYGSRVQQTNSGGYIISGNTNSFGAGAIDAYLVNVDPSGTVLWSKTYGGAANDYFNSVYQLSDSSFAMAGQTNSFGAGNEDFYFVKVDQIGNLTWAKTYGGILPDYNTSLVPKTTDGGYILAGRTDSYGAGNTDYYVVKTDAIGNVTWSKAYGGFFTNQNLYVQQTSDGGYITIGYTSFDFSSGSDDCYVVKTDVSGNILWTQSYGGLGSDIPSTVLQTSDGGYIISGYTLSFGAGNYDAFLMKISNVGALSWIKTYGGIQEDYGYGAAITSDGGYILSGFTNSFGSGGYDAYAIKTDASGNLLWSKTYGGVGMESCFDPHQTADGGYIFSGYTSSFGAGNFDCYLVKTDASGNSGCNETNPATIVTTPSPSITSGGVANIGGTANTPAVIVGIPATITNIQCPIPLPIELVSFTATCSNQSVLLKWSTQSETNNNYFIIECSNDGMNWQEIDKTQGAGNSNSIIQYSFDDNRISNGNSYYRLKQTDFDGNFTYSNIVSVSCETNRNEVLVYPNPTSDILHYQLFSSQNVDAEIKIYNSIGQVILSSVEKIIVGQNAKQINISALPAGSYLLFITINSKQTTSNKFIVR